METKKQLEQQIAELEAKLIACETELGEAKEKLAAGVFDESPDDGDPVSPPTGPKP